MSERRQPTGQLPKEPVRIVYHAENRTFARLFKEHSLDEVKDVVRRKLGLGQEADVSLKQIGSDALLDLEDDDDFQAFRVLLRSSVSVDIQVTVRFRGSAVPPPVTPEPPEQPSVSRPGGVWPASHSRQPARSVASRESSAHPEASLVIQASTTTIETSGPSARKRKVSFDNALAAPDKPARRRASKKVIAATPVEPTDSEEPPKKKQRGETVKAKDVRSTEAIQSSPADVSDTPKSKRKKSAVLGHEGEAELSAPKDTTASELPAKGQKRWKKNHDDKPKPSASVGQDDMDLQGQLNEPVNGPSHQLGSDKPKRTSAGVALKTNPPKGTVCASIPQTNASTSVQAEVAAAILSGCLSKANETAPPEPPAKGKSVKRSTKKFSASSSALPVQPTSVLVASVYERQRVPAKHRLAPLVRPKLVQTNGPSHKSPESNGPPCPICLEEPFHIRYYCPTVLKGPNAILERLEELKRMNLDDQESLIKELDGLLRDPEVTSKRSLDAALADKDRSWEVSRPHNISLLRRPTIPNDSCVSKVTVESGDERSDSESSDNMPHRGATLRKQQTPNGQPSATNDDLEAVIRGPVSKHKSILHVIDRIVGDKENEDSDSDEAELEGDPDEEVDRSKCRLSKHIECSSDSESEDGESASHSSSSLARDVSKNMQPGIQGSHNPAEEPAEYQDGDGGMRDSVDPPILERQDNDSSEETRIGSKDRMDVDHESINEKHAATIAERRPPSPPGDFFLPPAGDRSSEQQEWGQTNTDPRSRRDGDELAVSEAYNGVEVNPIGPADGLEPPTISRSSDAGPIETPPEGIGSLFTGVTQSTPKPGVRKRIKTRDGQITNGEAEHPVLLEQLTLEATGPTKGKSQRKTTKMSTTQDQVSMQRSPRTSSRSPSTNKSAAVASLNHRTNAGARIGGVTKTPAKQFEERSSALRSSIISDAAQNESLAAPTPSLIRWETLTEPSSPLQQLDEVSMRIDELVPSSPQPNDTPKDRSHELMPSSQVESSQRKERLFDLSSSQAPFPYSQYQNHPTPKACTNGKEDTDSEEEPKVSEKKAKFPVRYRSLSHLASQATTLFSPSLPMLANKSMGDRKTKKRVIREDSSSSSASDEAVGLEHIPRGRTAGSALETRKRRSTLSRT